MTGTEVATYQAPGGLALRGDQIDWTPAQRAALVQLGIAEAPIGDQQVFLHVAQRVGLDPFAKQIYLIGRNDSTAPGGKKWTIQTAIDGFRVFCERDSRYAGELGAEWCGEDGVWREVWTDQTKPPVAARFTVMRKDHEHPVRAVAHYREYVQTKFNGDPNHMWKTMPAGQIAKCAEALARRRLFPQDLGGIYTDEEMGHVDNPPPVIVQAEAQRPTEPDWDTLIRQHEQARDVTKLWELRKLAQGMRPNDGSLLNKIAEAWQRTKAAAQTAAAEPRPAAKPVSKTRMNVLSRLLAKGNVKTAEARLRLAAHVLELDHELTDFTDLTPEQVEELITRLERLDANGQLGAAPTDKTEQPADQPDTEGDHE